MSNPSNQSVRQPLAFKATRDWRPNLVETNTSPTPKIQFSNGTIGWARNQRGTWINVEIRRNGQAVHGWVPINAIQLGQPRATSMAIKLCDPVPPPGPPPINPNDDVLMRTLKLIWSSIKNGRDTLIRPTDRHNQAIGRVLFGPGVDRYAEILYRCMVPEAVQIMRSGNFNPRELFERLTPVGPDHTADKVRGTYLYFFGNIQHGFAGQVSSTSPPPDAVYVGQSNDYLNRRSMHMKCLQEGLPDKKKDSNLYKVARTSPEAMRKMSPFFVFRPNDAEVIHYGLALMTDVAELTQVCLFKSWIPLLTRESPSIVSGSQIMHYENARSFSNMMTLISQTTGWNPYPTVGLNWVTPGVSFMGQEREWICWYDWKRSSYIYRTSRTVHVHGGGKSAKVYILWRSGDNCYLNLSDFIQKQARFNNGDPVTLVVEIKNDGQRYIDHPVPWIRVPRPCHNREFEKLRSMSVQIQWQDRQTQAWKGHAVQWISSKAIIRGEYSMIIQGMAMLSTLTQTSYRNAPAWWESLDNTVVRQVKMDHLRQEAQLPATPLSGRLVDWPRNNTMEENRERLRRCVPPGFATDVFIGRKPAAGLGNARERCDLCLSIVDTGKCVQKPESGTCELCESLNRPCTWTVWKPGRALTDLTVSGGPLQDLGWPTYIQGMNAKVAKNMRHPAESFFLDSDEEPYSVSVGRQIQDETPEGSN